jgi:hypothetical protein
VRLAKILPSDNDLLRPTINAYKGTTLQRIEKQYIYKQDGATVTNQTLAALTVLLLTCIWNMTTLNLGQDADHPDYGLSQLSCPSRKMSGYSQIKS